MAIRWADYAGATSVEELLLLVEQENTEFREVEEQLLDVVARRDALNVREQELTARIAERSETPIWVRFIQGRTEETEPPA